MVSDSEHKQLTERTNMEVISLNSAQLKEAAALKEQIETLQERLNAVLGGAVSAPAPAVAGKRNPMSAEARAKIAAGQRARWREWRKEQKAKEATVANVPVQPVTVPPVATPVAAVAA